MCVSCIYLVRCPACTCYPAHPLWLLLLLRRPGESGAVHKDYWLTDGLYGSFNCILYDDQKPQPLVSSRSRQPDVQAAVLHAEVA